jgi:hypothetical protein
VLGGAGAWINTGRDVAAYIAEKLNALLASHGVRCRREAIGAVPVLQEICVGLLNDCTDT